MKMAASGAVRSCVLWVCNQCISGHFSHYNGQASVEYRMTLSQVLNKSQPADGHSSP